MKRSVLLELMFLFLITGKAQVTIGYNPNNNIIIEGEDVSAFNRDGSCYLSYCYPTGITHRLTASNRNKKISGIVSGNAYQQIATGSSSSKPTASYYLKNVLSGTYDIYAVIVPENMDDTTNVAPKYTKFMASLSYDVNDDDKPTTFTAAPVFASDPTKVDTLLLFQDYTLPCSYFDVWHDYPTISLSVYISIFDRKFVTNNLYIDCFILKGKGDSKYIEKDGICYEIDEQKNVATIIGGDTLVAPTNPIADSVYYKWRNYPITSIGNKAFCNNHCITSITLPPSVTGIGQYAFYGCSNLRSITIPNGEKAIGQYAFYGCSNLRSITIPNSVKTIGQYAFYGCSNLTSITLPDSLTTIEPSTFQNCTGLLSITIPDQVTKINDGAFENCSSINSITLSKNIKIIYETAFDYCNSLKKIICPLITPPEFLYDFGREFDGVTLYVPYGAKSNYDEVMYYFSSVQEMDQTAIHPILDDAIAGQDFYSINGVKLPQMYQGINVVKYNNGSTKKILLK